MPPFYDPAEYEERAYDLYDAGDFDAALAVFQAGLSVDPNCIDLLNGMGMTQLAREEFMFAERCFNHVLQLNPNDLDALVGLGDTRFMRGDFDAGMASFRRALAHGATTDVDLLLQMGYALFEHERFVEARRMFDLACVAAPESAEPAAAHAYTLHRLGDVNGAMAGLRRALDLDPACATARIFLANICFDRDQFGDALRHFSMTSPEDHTDPLGIERFIDLYAVSNDVTHTHANLSPWRARLRTLLASPDPLEAFLRAIEAEAERA
jgi:Flp pilus assembly protein TadD